MTKTIYSAPTAEQIDLKIEKNFMSLAGGSAQAEDVQEIQSSEIYNGASW